MGVVQTVGGCWVLLLFLGGGVGVYLCADLVFDLIETIRFVLCLLVYAFLVISLFFLFSLSLLFFISFSVL